MRLRQLAGRALVALVAAGGCGGALDRADTGQPEQDTGQPGQDTSRPPQIDASPTTVAALCASALGERLWVQSPAEMRTTLTGMWALCSDQGLFGTPHAAVQIGADDRWRMQEWSGDTLVPIAGLEHAGAMNYFDASQAGQVLVQVDFVGDFGGTIISIPVISDVPRMMLINNNGVAEYLYARLP